MMTPSVSDNVTRLPTRQQQLLLSVEENHQETLQSIIARRKEVLQQLEQLHNGTTLLCNEKDLDQFEQKVHELTRELADLTTASRVQKSMRDPEFTQECKAAVKLLPKQLVNKGLRPVKIRFFGGTSIILGAHYWSRKGSAGRKGKGLYPGLCFLGIYDHCTPLLASSVSQASAALCSFKEAQMLFAERGCKMDVKTIRSISKRFADRARLALDTAELPEVGTAGEQIKNRKIIVSTDGGRLRIRQKKRGPRTKKGRNRYTTCWREPKLMIIYIVDEEGRADHHFLPLIDGTLNGPDAVFMLLYRYLRTLGVDQADKILFVADGAKWIWARVTALKEQLKAEGIDCEFIELIDFYHAAQHLHAFAQAMTRWKPKARKQWISLQKKRLKNGQIDDVIDAMKEAKKGSRKKELRKELMYFVNNRHRFSYQKVAGLGLPIGSGAMESAIRRVVNLRLKGPCIYWKQDTAEQMILLRSYYKSGRWNDIKEMAAQGELRRAA